MHISLREHDVAAELGRKTQKRDHDGHHGETPYPGRKGQKRDDTGLSGLLAGLGLPAASTEQPMKIITCHHAPKRVRISLREDDVAAELGKLESDKTANTLGRTVEVDVRRHVDSIVRSRLKG